jgi:hypothetical protein
MMKIDEMDDLYEIVGHELKNSEERPGLMARAIAEADGNPEKAKSIYIRYRVEELSENRRREAEKKALDEAARQADPVLAKIQELLRRPTMDSYQQILTLLKHRLINQGFERWTVEEPTGCKRYLSSFGELESYTKKTAERALGFVKSNANSWEAPSARPDEPFQSASAFPKAISSRPKNASRESVSHPEVKASKQPPDDEQWSEAIPKMAQPQKKQANWPLRIVLYIALLLAWIFAAGFLSVFIKGVRHSLLEQVLARHMDADQAATVVGVLAGVGQFILLLAIISLAIVIWRKTRDA